MQLMKESCSGEPFKIKRMFGIFLFFLFALRVYYFNIDFVCRTRQHFCQQFTLAKDSSLCLIFRPAFDTLAVFYVEMTSPLAYTFLFY